MEGNVHLWVTWRRVYCYFKLGSNYKRNQWFKNKQSKAEVNQKGKMVTPKKNPKLTPTKRIYYILEGYELSDFQHFGQFNIVYQITRNHNVMISIMTSIMISDTPEQQLNEV